jgi:hypothetical protein
MNLMSCDLKIKPKMKLFQKNLKNVKKMTVFLVYTLIRAKPFFDIDITNAHNPSDQEELSFIPNLPGLGIMIFFLYQLFNKIVPKLTKCLKWVMF